MSYSSQDLEPATKHARLNALGTGLYVSMSGLAAVLKTVREHGLPDASSRSTHYRLRKALCNQMTPYGRLVESIDLPVIYI